jgi:hypothetical protein
MYHFETEFQIQLYFYISVKTIIRGKIAEDTGVEILAFTATKCTCNHSCGKNLQLHAHYHPDRTLLLPTFISNMPKFTHFLTNNSVIHIYIFYSS